MPKEKFQWFVGMILLVFFVIYTFSIANSQTVIHPQTQNSVKNGWSIVIKDSKSLIYDQNNKPIGILNTDSTGNVSLQIIVKK